MTTASQSAIAPSISERELQEHVVAMAKALGWSVFHPWLSIHSAAGWPDLFMVRGPVALAVELKTETGKVSWQQTVWLGDLARVPGIQTAVWRPTDLISGHVEQLLRQRQCRKCGAPILFAGETKLCGACAVEAVEGTDG